MVDLATAVRSHRHNMGVRAAASEIGISPTTVTRIERGGVPDIPTLEKICVWLGEDPDQFTGVRSLRAGFACRHHKPARNTQALAKRIQQASERFSRDVSASH